MCLAVPGKIIDIPGSDSTDDPLFRMGRVDFGGITKNVNLSCLPEAKQGDYVLVHVGFGLSIVDREEARKTLDLLRQMGELDGELEGALRGLEGDPPHATG
jgi:hydrogenase expression/formation protein HypC